MNSSGLVYLVRGVRTFLDAQNAGAEVRVGMRERTKQINQGRNGANRVIFTPGDLQGNGGAITGAHKPGGNPRRLYTWEKISSVSIWASDPNNPRDEECQIEAVERLFELTVAAVHAVARNDARWGSVKFTTSPVEMIFGMEILAELTHHGPLFDLTSEVVIPTPALTRDITT